MRVNLNTGVAAGPMMVRTVGLGLNSQSHPLVCSKSVNLALKIVIYNSRDPVQMQDLYTAPSKQFEDGQPCSGLQTCLGGWKKWMDSEANSSSAHPSVFSILSACLESIYFHFVIHVAAQTSLRGCLTLARDLNECSSGCQSAVVSASNVN
jgi:hypothetical protein